MPLDDVASYIDRPGSYSDHSTLKVRCAADWPSRVRQCSHLRVVPRDPEGRAAPSDWSHGSYQGRQNVIGTSRSHFMFEHRLLICTYTALALSTHCIKYNSCLG